MFFLYNALLYLLFIPLLPLFVVFYILDAYAFRERTGIPDPDAVDSRKSILVHGASLGEMTIVKKLLPALRMKYPDYPLIVSSTTVAGKRHIQETMGGFISHAVCMPLEYPFTVRRMLKRANPAVVVITETELWPNLLRESKRSGARLVLVNGRISDKSFPKYSRSRFFFRRVIATFDAIGVQNAEYRDRFAVLGAPRGKLSITGNIKESLERKPVDAGALAALRAALGLAPHERLFIAASTRPGEEPVVFDAFHRLKARVPGITLLLAPRHLSRLSEVETLLKSASFPFVRKSAVTDGPVERDVILLDTLGELSSLFAAAEIAFVGGTLADFGGHNLLEPLPSGVPVCFGPSVSEQRESARLILEHGCGAKVKDAAELAEFAARVLQEEPFRNALQHGIDTLFAASKDRLKANLVLI